MASEGPRKPPRLYRNFISLIGATIVVASVASIVFLFLTELFGSRSKPYLGIFTYIIFPGCMLFGIAIILLGMLVERRRRRKQGSSAGGAYPTD